MKRIIGIIVLILLIFAFYKLVTFKLFDVNPELLKTIEVPKKNYKIKIYYIQGNATLQEGIQLRKAENNEEFTLNNFEMYNAVDNAKVKGDFLFLKIKDSTGEMPLKNVKILLPQN